MSIAISEEHQELARVARAFLESHGARSEARLLLDEAAERLPSFWKEMAELGWMGLHIDEASGGQGFGLAELSIVLEEMGFAMAPGPYLPTTLAAALLAAVACTQKEPPPAEKTIAPLPALEPGWAGRLAHDIQTITGENSETRPMSAKSA